MFMILNQSYTQKVDGSKAQLIDICGDEAILELEEGKMLKISTTMFRTFFTFNR